ncbi:MAG: hypothetical protein P8178_04890 [Candidatus Thiodiazotropha sp.]
MSFPGTDLSTISRQFETAAATVVAASRTAGSAAADADHSPTLLEQAMRRLLDLLSLVEKRAGSPEDLSRHEVDIDELGDYAIHLLSDLSSAGGALGLDDASRKLEDLTLPMALWIVRHDGGLRSLEPVVNALARLANTLREPSQLAQLYQLAAELHRGVDAQVRMDLEKGNPGRPWRLLTMNQAIIATRSHRPELIDEAYQALTEALPEEAPRFFEEGMQQMEALNYPQAVRQVVARYYDLWHTPRTLH